MRRAGWNAITFNYRGSWGSPGNYRFAQNPEDAKAVLAFLRDPQNAAKYGIDTKHIAIVGHSMGGWVAATVGGQDNGLLGVGMISAANMGREGAAGRAEAIKLMTDNMEALAGVTYLAPAVLERLLLERTPPTVPVKELAIVADMDWGEQIQAAVSD